MHARMFMSFPSAVPTWGANTTLSMLTDQLFSSSLYQGYYIGTSSNVGDTDTLTPTTLNGVTVYYFYSYDAATDLLFFGDSGTSTPQGLFKNVKVNGQTYAAKDAIYTAPYYDDKTQTQYTGVWYWDLLGGLFTTNTTYSIEFEFYKLDGSSTITIGNYSSGVAYGKFSTLAGSESNQTQSQVRTVHCYYTSGSGKTTLLFEDVNSSATQVTFGATIKATYNGTDYTFTKFNGYNNGSPYYQYTGDCFNMNSGTVGQTRDITWTSAVPL